MHRHHHGGEHADRWRLHARATGEVEHDRVVRGTKRFLRERFGVEHTTLQVEYTDECVDHAPPPQEEEQVR